MNVNGIIDKYKSEFIIQRFRQKPGVEYFDIYGLVLRIYAIRLIISLACTHDLIVHQMDVKTSLCNIFLNCELNEEVYIKQPEGFVMLVKENIVCKLLKSLYGLK